MEEEIKNLERELAEAVAEMQRQMQILENEITSLNSKLEETASQLRNIRLWRKLNSQHIRLS